MASIKKAFAPIVEILEANMDAPVSEVFNDIVDIAKAKTGGGGSRATSFHRNEDGEVVAIKCYYHGLWMSPDVAEFGKKASSATGFNSMCKDGVSKWTKQQNAAKKAKEALLTQLANGKVDQADLASLMQDLEEQRDAVEPREDGYGFETLEECLADNAERGLAH